ncbi:MAG: transcriptional regulator PpsR [Gemmatimonas sp.]
MSRQDHALNTGATNAPLMDRDAVMALAAATGDVALVVNSQGVILSASANEGAEAERADVAAWVGRPWVDTVTPESRPRIDALMTDAATQPVARRRNVNHITQSGHELPIAYTAVKLNGDEPGVVAIGRDMRHVAALQQRLVETQQALERDYWQLRHVETRYRLLFQVSSEAILVVDAHTRRVVDANDAAARLFGRSADKLVGRTFPLDFDAASESALLESLAHARSAGNARVAQANLHTGAAVEVNVACYRQDALSQFLIRLTPLGAPGVQSAHVRSDIDKVMENAPDGFVITDMSGRVIFANRSFLDLAQLNGEPQTRGRLLSDWIGRPGADLGVFLSTLQKHGAIRLMTSAVRGEQGGESEVEISAAGTPAEAPQFLGFIVRDVGRRVSAGPQGARDLTQAVSQLTQLVGRVALRDLVRDTTDLVERHFIEAALALTEDNRTAAAEVLGLSRQSLYVKMRRYEIALYENDLNQQAG